MSVGVVVGQVDDKMAAGSSSALCASMALTGDGRHRLR